MSALFRETDLLFVVTGATGWLGRATLDLLDSALSDSLADRVVAYSRATTSIALRSGRSMVTRPHDRLGELVGRRAVILHYAFLTREHAGLMPLAEYIDRNQAISAGVIEMAARNEVAGLFLPSSGAVYGPDGTLVGDVETNPYGVLKLRDERDFSEFASSAKCPLAIARVFNLSGWGMNKTGAYALGSILNNVLNHQPITLRARHNVVRSYVDVQDLVRLAFACLTDGPGLVVFDTAGETEIEVGDLARLALQVLKSRNSEILRPAPNGENEDRYVGNAQLIRSLAALHKVTFRPLEQQILDTAAFLRRG